MPEQAHPHRERAGEHSIENKAPVGVHGRADRTSNDSDRGAGGWRCGASVGAHGDATSDDSRRGALRSDECGGKTNQDAKRAKTNEGHGSPELWVRG